MVSGMLHDVVEDHPKRPRENDMNCPLDLTCEEGPFRRVVVPRHTWMGVVKKDHKANQPIPAELR